MDRYVLGFLIVASFVLGTLMTGGVLAVDPQGANFSGETTTAYSSSPEGHSAYAGNITQMDVAGFSTTQSWQGYYGNVTGAIQLADSSGNALYNWSLATVGGEIYVSNVSSGLLWDSVACFDLYTNATQLEIDFNVSADALDGLNDTFNLNNHEGFTTAGTSFSGGQCNNTKLLNNTGAGTFDEVLLTDGAGAPLNAIYAAILKTDYTGFDGNTHDFEMLVLENGGSGVASATTYYFYAELE